MNTDHRLTRRAFLASSTLLLAAGCGTLTRRRFAAAEPIIDIHQHTNYHGRTDAELVAHQRRLGVSLTVLLPAGRFYGLEAGCGGNDTVRRLARRHPREFIYFANEVADLPDATAVIERELRRGAVGIGEQKFKVHCDSPPIEAIAELAQEYDVPVLVHFQHGTYNLGIERFGLILARFPTVNFIGHAQTWWGNIDARHDQTVMYPTGPVTPGGLTDRLLCEFPNLYAGSGLNALLRDEAHARAFLDRHQDKLLFGSDCADAAGEGDDCQGAQILAALRRLAPSKAIERKILFANAARLLKLSPLT
jgi:predicted TIM-barrel fold metal-dependent hydrolase